MKLTVFLKLRFQKKRLCPWTKYHSISLCQIEGYFLLIIHQIFSLACDWSNHITWPNIPPLRFQKSVCFSEQIMFVDKYPSKRNKRRLFSIYVLVSHGKSLPPDPSPKFPQFIPPPVFPNLPHTTPPPLSYWPQQSFSGFLKRWLGLLNFWVNIHSTYM